MSVYISSGTSYVSRGQVLDTPYVYRSGSVVVLSGGSVSAAFLSNGGTEIVSSGGVDWGADIVSGGQMTISIGGLTSLTSVYSSGSLVASGGRISNCILFDEGAKMYVGGVDLGSTIAKGIASDVSVRGGGSAIVRAYGVGSAVKVESGYLYVINRGYIENTTVGGSSGTAWAARTYIQEGGSAYRTTVSSNGIFVVSYGAHVSQTTVYSGGSVLVSSAGIVSGTTACGGVIHLLPTASALDTTLTQNAYYAGGSMYISSGASATSTTIQYGQLTILNGGYTFGSNHLIDGVLWVESGARAFTFDVSSGAIYVSAGGSAVGLTMYGGVLHMEADSSGGTAVASADLVSIMGNARANVKSGGSITDVTVVGSGLLDVDDGAFASGVEILSSGARMRVTRGYANSVVISSGGSVYAADGRLYDVTVKTSGSMTLLGSSYLSGGSVYGSVMVSSGASATAVSVMLLGSMTVSGRASNCTVYSAGRVTVAGGKLTGTFASTGGIFTIESNGTAFVSGTGISATLNGGSMYAASAIVKTADVNGGSFHLRESAYASNGRITAGTFTISAGASAGNVSACGSGGDTGSALARLMVLSDGKAIDGRITGPYALMSVYAGGIASRAIVESGGTAMVSGLLSSGTVYSGGYVYMVSDQGVANQTYVAGGFLDINSGAMAQITSVYYSGAAYVQSGGAAKWVYVSSGGTFLVKTGGSAFSAYIGQGGIATVNSGGSLSVFDVSSGGLLTVLSSGSATSATLRSGSVILNGNGRLTTAYVENGGTIDVLDSASLYSAFVSQGGQVTNLGGMVGGLTVSKGGTMICRKGTVWGNVLSGGEIVFAGGWTDTLTVNSGGKVRITDYLDFSYTGGISLAGGTMDFDISKQVSPSATVLLDGFDLIDDVDGTASFTLTVSDAQAKAEYKLASNAAAFNQTITVQNAAGTALGTLSVGQTASIGGVDYALNLGADDVLSVTVGAVAPVPGSSAKSDIDGNGISDVMFVWTGAPEQPGNYQHGYWMNGTNEWQSQNGGHPAEWENLGCYDMSGDGKADSVLVGNVIVDEVKGAYIGYYADAIDAIDGSTWVNIGYLNNADDITWKNKVGNLTGNASGANSIVWYTPDLGALGAWTDGTDTWVGLGGGYDSNWKLIGCGDFDGDGKDSVVMCYNSGEKYYAVNIDGAASELALSDSGWEVRAIGDFSGDGKDDIVAFHAETGLVAMWGDGDSANWSQLGQLDAEDWFVVGAGDYDGDAQDDLLVRQNSTGMLGYYSSADMAQWNTLGYGVDMSWTVIA